MTGELKVRATARGFAIDMDLHGVGMIDKFELMSAIATGIGMDALDMNMFCHLQRMGVFDAAKQVTHCDTAEELDRMLTEGAANASDDLVDLLRKLANKLEETK